jgi:hypothetical protein
MRRFYLMKTAHDTKAGTKIGLIGLKIDGKARKIFFSKKHKNKN